MIKLINFFFVIILFTTIGFSKQPAKVKTEMNLDNKGNADLIYSQTLDATSWQNWFNNYGNNAALLKHNFDRLFPSYFLSDFKLEKNEVNRTFIVSFKAYGVCKISNNGEWIIETGDKNVDLTKLESKTYMYSLSTVENNEPVQVTTLIHVPSQSRNIRIENDAFGKTILRFGINSFDYIKNILVGTGIFLILIGSVSIIITNQKLKVNTQKTQTLKIALPTPS